MSTFQVRTIYAEGGRREDAAFDLVPELPQGKVVCNLFAEFLARQPAAFREKLTFVNKGDFELDWSAASGGSAFAALYGGGEALAMAALVAGANAESDGNMLAALRTSVLEPMLGEEAASLADTDARPAVVMLRLPGQPELAPAVQLLMTALASVYFRAVARASGAPE